MDPKNKHRIVYADDAVMHHLMMKAMVQSYGLELVFCVSNGMELIDYLMKHQDMLPEVCIMDLHMPKLNGIETAKIIQQQFPSVRIIGLTSSSDEHERLELLSSGAEHIFSKEEMPLLLEQLASGI